MKWFMIASINIKEYDGISKKIITQAGALANNEETTYLACFVDGVFTILEVSSDNTYTIKYKKVTNGENNSLVYIRQCKWLAQNVLISSLLMECQKVYIRHMFPNVKLITLLKYLKKKKKNVVYEIPTYPYYYEQMSESHNKIKTFVRLNIETIYWPFIYKYIDRLTVIRCQSHSLHLKKMKDIKNGVRAVCSIEKRHAWYDEDYFNIIGVGTIYKYHGYDRLINAIFECGGYVRGKKILFYIVGESDEIERLKRVVSTSAYASHIIFCGKKFGTELEELYNISNLAIGTLALNLRKADIDTAIKNIEYMGRQLPIISSGKIFDIDEELGLYLNIGSEGKINMDELADFAKTYYKNGNDEIVFEILESFTWKSIMESAIEGI